MKRGIILLAAIWYTVLTVASNTTKQLQYEIHYASLNPNTFEIKQQVHQIYQELVGQVDTEYHIDMVRSAISQFEQIPNSKATLQGSVIQIVIGDGKGMVIRGSLESVCKAEVKKRSLVLELLGK